MLPSAADACVPSYTTSRGTPTALTGTKTDDVCDGPRHSPTKHGEGNQMTTDTTYFTKEGSEGSQKPNSNLNKPAAEGQLGRFFDDVEDLLRRTTHLQDDEITRVRNKVESSLASARTSIERGARRAVDSATFAAKSTNDYVQSNPWKAIGVAAAACLAVGLLRRR